MLSLMKDSSLLSPLEGTVTVRMKVHFNLTFIFFLMFIHVDSPYQYAAQFNSDGYIALPRAIFPRR